jgi:hypothetical protein
VPPDPRKYPADILLGFDTEYVSGTVNDLVLPEDDDRTKTNAVLCYSFRAIDPNNDRTETLLVAYWPLISPGQTFAACVIFRISRCAWMRSAAPTPRPQSRWFYQTAEFG